jgi:hypothetical protein
MRNLRLIHSDSWFEQSTQADDCPSASETARDEIDVELPALNPAVAAMVERVRVVVALPPVVRARAIARARAVVAATRR